MALMVAVQGSMTVAVNTNAPVATPDALGAAMQTMVVVVPAVQVPVGSYLEPLDASPAPVDTVAI